MWALGIDLGADALKVALLRRRDRALELVHSFSATHGKDPAGALIGLLRGLDLSEVTQVAATGRLARVLRVAQVPTKAALRTGVRLVHPELEAVTVISIGAHGFAVLELHPAGRDAWQENSRCSQGTGNFLAQLVARFGLSVEQAAQLADAVVEPASLSGRCPVILKTDMTHLGNQGVDRAAIVAGLFDAVSENVLSLVRPGICPAEVLLVGGVTRAVRIRRRLEQWLRERGMKLVPVRQEDEIVEAIGAAAHALDLGPGARVELGRVEDLLAPPRRTRLDRVPPLRSALARVRRLPDRSVAPRAGMRVILGLDIGSTGSKAVAVEVETGSELWRSYLETEGAPVTAAQRLVERYRNEVGGMFRLVGFGVTGSGREVVGTLLRNAYGPERVFILNEIAAHARAAVALDPEVDTIFEIGGQDAKYIRLENGAVIDAALNEACSAGTGSFIAEQGLKLEGVGRDVSALGRLALESEGGVSLGQHCSVFMAEVIDEAVSQGFAPGEIVAGLYDSVIQNYLNRVKGNRTIGSKVFCQGMPFAAEALAAAVARQTGREVVVPPHPGTMGALGIALLLREERGAELEGASELDPASFLAARVRGKQAFVCQSTKGCGGTGNRCRIDRLVVELHGREHRFLWGGACSLYDRGASRAKLPDGAYDPFREREALIDALLLSAESSPGRPVVGLTDEFVLKGLLPLVVTWLGELGFSCRVLRHAGGGLLRRGIERGRVPYCAPLQLYHGAMLELAGQPVDALLLPMVKSLPRFCGEQCGELCPMVLGSPDLVSGVLPAGAPPQFRPVLEFDRQGYHGPEFRRRMLAWAEALGRGAGAERALARAVQVQEEFESRCRSIGQQALDYCRQQGLVPVAVLGRPYTLYNDVLNSNVPSLLRSLGAIPIPVDCLPIGPEVPVFERQYWSYTQLNLRAATLVRQTPGLYSVFCSNYACGPDSFTLHFYSYTMQNKPSAVIETDGHSGDAGTKTRLEAFLYCVDTDRRERVSERARVKSFLDIDRGGTDWEQCRLDRARVLIPRMGPGAELASAALRAEGLRAETLPLSTHDDLLRGRQHTSGKECLPMILTLGTVLNHLDRELGPEERAALFMPTTRGPCRFGVYCALHRLVYSELGLGDRVSIISPDDTDYFRGTSLAFAVRLWLGFLVHDLVQAMLLDTRPVEVEPGAADALYARYFQQLLACLSRPTKSSRLSVVAELLGGMWGLRSLLLRAARDFARIKDSGRRVPRVALVGEIYVRLDPFANDRLIEQLEARGLGVRLAPFVEWLEYIAHLGHERVKHGQLVPGDDPVGTRLSALIQRATLSVLYEVCQKALGWPEHTSIQDTLGASARYLHPELTGEAALTLGAPIHDFRRGLIEGVVIVGPHECMPCKLAEAQYGKVAEECDLPYVTLSVHGDPIDPEVLDRFAYDIRERIATRRAPGHRLPLLVRRESAPASRFQFRCPRFGEAALAGAE